MSSSDEDFVASSNGVPVPRSDRVLRAHRTPAQRLQVSITSARTYPEINYQRRLAEAHERGVRGIATPEDLEYLFQDHMMTLESEEEARVIRSIEEEEGIEDAIPAHILDPNPEDPARKRLKLKLPEGHYPCIFFFTEMCCQMGVLSKSDGGALICEHCLRTLFESRPIIDAL